MSIHRNLTNDSSDVTLHQLHLPGYTVTTATARDAISTMNAGELAYVQASGLYYVYAGNWKPFALGAATITGNTVNNANLIDHTHAVTITSADVTIPVVGSPTYNTDEELSTLTNSAGVLDATVTYVTSGVNSTHINVAAGKGLLRTSNSPLAQLKSIEWAASNGIYISAGVGGIDSTRFIGIAYSGGSPQVAVKTTFNWNWNTDFPLARVSQDGTTLRILNAYAHSEDTANRVRRFNRLTMPFVREEAPEGTGGLELAAVTSGGNSQYISMTAGNIWHGLNQYILSAVNTSGAGRFDSHYRNGSGGFTNVTNQQQWDNTHYDDGTGILALMTNNKYAVHWVYVDVSDGSLDIIFGRGQYNSSTLAQAESVPSTIPGHLQYHGRLIGRIIFQKSATTPDLVQSAWSNAFNLSGATTHNELAGLQGGTTSEYYHLTNAEYTGTGTGNFVRLTGPTLTKINLSDTSNQLVLQSAGVTGTITWTPTTGNKVLTIPDVTGTLVLGTGTLGQLVFFNSTNVITGSANITWQSDAFLTMSHTLSGFPQMYMVNTTNDANCAAAYMQKQRNGAAVQNNDSLGYFPLWMGYQNSAYRSASYVVSAVDGVPSGNFVPARIVFFTGTDAAVPAEAMRISADKSVTVQGALNIAATSNQIVLQSAGVTGTLTWTPATSNKIITVPNLTGTIALGAGSSTITSTNDVTVASHTHAVTSSSSPGAGAWLLASGTDGSIVFGSSASQGFSVTPTTANGSGAAYGVYSVITLNGTTGTGAALYGRVNTAATSFTATSTAACFLVNPIKGAGSTITTNYGLYIEAMTSGSTNYAILAAGGLTLLQDATDSSSTTTGALVVSGGVGIAKKLIVGTRFGLQADPPSNTGIYCIPAMELNGGTVYSLFSIAAITGTTGGAVGTYTRVDTGATAFTLGVCIGLQIANPNKGAGSTITTNYGLYIEAQTAGAANYAIVVAGGQISTVDATDSTSTTTGSIITAGGIGVAKDLTALGVNVGSGTGAAAGQIFAFTPITINSSSAVDAVTGATGFIAVLRDQTNGGTALILYENATTPVIVSQAGTTVYVTGAPGATQIQVANRGANSGITLKGGSSRNGIVVNVGVFMIDSN